MLYFKSQQIKFSTAPLPKETTVENLVNFRNQLMKLSHSILVESRSARINTLSSLDTDRILEIFDKVKSIIFGVWNGTGYATTAQIAVFYEVTERAINILLDRHADEFAGEVKTLKGKELQDARNVLCLPPKTSQANAWTAKAMLRVGMLLAESEIARAVRDFILDCISSFPTVPVVEEIHYLAKIDMTLLEASAQTGQAILTLASGTKSGFEQTEQIIKSASKDVKLSVAAESVTVVSEVRHAAQDVTDEVITVQKMLTDLGTQVTELKHGIPVIGDISVTKFVKARQLNPKFHSSITVHLSKEEYDFVSSLAKEENLSRARFVYNLMRDQLF